MYGVLRTLVKAAGRLRRSIPLWWILNYRYPFKTGAKVGIIGCGQFSYSAIAYFLTASTKCKLSWCSDIDLDAAQSLAIAYGITNYSEGCEDYLENTDLVYIASNHASHTAYAIQSMKAGCDVYIEKPISTTREQLNQLVEVLNLTKKKIYVGYNRPHAPSIKLVKSYIKDQTLPITLSCFITGHFIPADHWYRDPREGTRVSGNLGHWLDLAIHMIFWSRESVDSIKVFITYSDEATPSDNFCVSLCTPRGDLVTLTFSSRSEPFEGVNESINFQQGNVIAKIDDHRHTQIWAGDSYISKHHWPKNVGHRNAILQPFDETQSRDWEELLVSTDLMLEITEMVKGLETFREYKFLQAFETCTLEGE